MKKETKTILIIAEKTQVKSLLAQVLAERFNLITASGGKEGIQRLTQIKDIHLVFVEHELTDLNGLSVLRSIREIDHDLPAAFIAGRSSNKVVSAAVECGIVAYLIKPLRNDDVEKIVSKIFANPHRKKSDVECARDYIEAHLTERVTVEAIAANCRVGYRQIARKFKNVYGCTISEYIRRRRVEKAKELLIEHQLLVYEIADSIGFPNSKTFCATFKSITNMTPSQFQRVMVHSGISSRLS